MNKELYITNEEDEILCLKEECEKYILEKDKTEIKPHVKVRDKKHDKIFKDILQNKAEIAQFLRKFTNYKICAEELEIYNPNYITRKYEYKNADIVYRAKNKELYFLIEHQTKVDYSMAYRIFNYSLEIIRSAVQEKTINRFTYRYPRIIPIVLYTGNKKWCSSDSFAKIQEGKSENDLILEKCKNNEEVITYLSMIRKNIKNSKQMQQLRRIISYLYENEREEIIRKIIRIIEESECEENMSTVAERIAYSKKCRYK